MLCGRLCDAGWACAVLEPLGRMYVRVYAALYIGSAATDRPPRCDAAMSVCDTVLSCLHHTVGSVVLSMYAWTGCGKPTVFDAVTAPAATATGWRKARSTPAKRTVYICESRPWVDRCLRRWWSPRLSLSSEAGRSTSVEFPEHPVTYIYTHTYIGHSGSELFVMHAR